MNIGDKVYFRWEYSLINATVVRVNKKTVTLFVQRGGFSDHERKVKFEDIVLPSEPCVMVWETWKGVNGRGGYRLEKVLYPEHHKLPKYSNNFEGYTENKNPFGNS